jgi:hypothetical protein
LRCWNSSWWGRVWDDAEIVGAALEVLQRKFDHPDIQIATLRDDHRAIHHQQENTMAKRSSR